MVGIRQLPDCAVRGIEHEAKNEDEDEDEDEDEEALRMTRPG